MILHFVSSFFSTDFGEEIAYRTCFDKKKLLLRQSVISKCTMEIDSNVLKSAVLKSGFLLLSDYKISDKQLELLIIRITLLLLSGNQECP